jgi:hypothetical protein
MCPYGKEITIEKNVDVHFCPILFTQHCFFMVPRIRPLVLMIRFVLRTRRSWKIIHMVLTSAKRGNVCINVTVMCVRVTILDV